MERNVPVEGAPESSWKTAVRDAVDVVRERGVEFVLVLLGTTIPVLLGRVVLGLRVAGWVFVALGAFALLRPVEFLDLLPYLLGTAFLALGALGLWLGRRVHEATSAVRLAEQALQAFRERARPPTP